MIASRRRFLLGASALALAPAIVRAESLMPLSVLRPAAAPSPWLPCKGQAVSRALYPALFRVIGDEFGIAPPGQFRLPSMSMKTLTVDFGGVVPPIVNSLEVCIRAAPLSELRDELRLRTGARGVGIPQAELPTLAPVGWMSYRIKEVLPSS